MADPNDTFWEEVCIEISKATKYSFKAVKYLPISSGVTGETFQLRTTSESVFLKRIEIDRSNILDAETEGLRTISATNTLRTPSIIATGESTNFAWLALEFIFLTNPNSDSSIKMGENLASMHQFQNNFHGWHATNWIGATRQYNSYEADWPNFFKEFRLLPQLKLALTNNLDSSIFDNGKLLLGELSKFFANYCPSPSLLHGDLWAGNWAADPDGSPIAFDPACYYGDRETDIAMTELFGGFHQNFYTAYNSINPLDKGYIERKSVYNLYHILNHFNIFGASYQQQASDLIMKSLTALR